MGFSLVGSLVKFTIKHVGDGLTGGLIPIGSIAVDVYEEWRKNADPSAAAPGSTAQADLRTALEKIIQDPRAYRQEVEASLARTGADAEGRRLALAYLLQVPGRIQASMRRPEDATGRTIPPGLVLRRADDLKQFLPERPPRFAPGDVAVPGTDLVVQDLLGAGGFGEVWKAIHRSRPHAPPVALKFCTDEAAARSLRKEVELLDRVATQGRHKGIVELKYAHLEGQTPCLEYEFVDGGDLAGLIADLHRRGKANSVQMTKILCAVAQPVGFAHRLRPPIVHRDLKPQNVLTTRIDNKVQLKIADFGIGGLALTQAATGGETARAAGTMATQSSGTCTPLYASPQQRRGGPPDPRDDVYALGVIWYQMLVGDVTREPPRGEAWKKRLHEQGTTGEMIALLGRCLEDDPTERPADAHVLAEELLRLLQSAPTPPPPRTPPPTVPPPTSVPLQEHGAHPPCPFVLGMEGLVTNAERRLPCVLLLDLSRSMVSRLEELSHGLAVYQTELQADDLAGQRVEVAVLGFGTDVQMLCPFTTADQFQPPALQAGGKTAMGRAVHWAIDLIEQRRRQYRTHGVPSFRPWVFLLTDGRPTDEWQSAARRVQQGEASRTFCFHAVAVEGADLGILGALGGRPPVRLQGLRFRELFRWLSQSQRMVSRSRPGEEDRIPFANPAGPGGWAIS
jgi:uncharacterized protein YegL